MLRVERQQEVLKRIQEERAVRLEDLCKAFGVSISTMRRDVEALSRKHPISFTYGGVLYDQDAVQPGPLPPAVGTGSASASLALIGQRAADLVQERHTIVIDGGKTTYELAAALGKRRYENVTIITTSIASASVLGTGFAQHSTIVLGGEYRENYQSIVGTFAEQMAGQIKTDILFVGATAVSAEGFFTTSIRETTLRRILCQNARRTVLLTDSSKFGREAGFLVGELDLLDQVITDAGITQEWRDILADRGIELTCV